MAGRFGPGPVHRPAFDPLPTQATGRKELVVPRLSPRFAIGPRASVNKDPICGRDLRVIRPHTPIFDEVAAVVRSHRPSIRDVTRDGAPIAREFGRLGHGFMKAAVLATPLG